MVNNRTCFLCGKKYSYCPTCSKDKLKPTWYAMFCSEECHDVDAILSDCTAGNITEEVAAAKLREAKADKIVMNNADSKAYIEKLLAVKKVVKSAPKAKKEAE